MTSFGHSARRAVYYKGGSPLEGNPGTLKEAQVVGKLCNCNAQRPIIKSKEITAADTLEISSQIFRVN
jgi:hypothetical protein